MSSTNFINKIFGKFVIIILYLICIILILVRYLRYSSKTCI